MVFQSIRRRGAKRILMSDNTEIDDGENLLTFWINDGKWSSEKRSNAYLLDMESAENEFIIPATNTWLRSSNVNDSNERKEKWESLLNGRILTLSLVH